MIDDHSKSDFTSVFVILPQNLIKVFKNDRMIYEEKRKKNYFLIGNYICMYVKNNKIPEPKPQNRVSSFATCFSRMG